MPTEISILSESEDGLRASEVRGMLPFQTFAGNAVTTSVNDGKLRDAIAAICESLNPMTIDPDNRLGLAEMELSLVVSCDATVKLLGEFRGGATASIKLTLRRRP